MTDTEYELIARRIKGLYGIDLDCYKSKQMRRRLDAYLARVKARSWPEYFRRLEGDSEERTRFKNYLTINVTSFFRDSDKFRDLREKILPTLYNKSKTLKVWSAGCSAGAEPYTLAMIFEADAPEQKVRIWATDIDRGNLAIARAGGPYDAKAVESVPRAMLTRYFEVVEDGYLVKPEVRKRITFQEHNLLRDAIRDRFDLIVCRNVIIYFTEEAKRAVFKRFAEVLNPGGVLFIGATETMQVYLARELGFEPITMSFYRRVTEEGEEKERATSRTKRASQVRRLRPVRAS